MPDVFRAKVVTEGEELLRNERLDGGGVERPLPARDRGDVGTERLTRLLPEPVGVFDDHVGAAEDLEDRLFFRGYKGYPRSLVQAEKCSSAASLPLPTAAR